MLRCIGLLYVTVYKTVICYNVYYICRIAVQYVVLIYFTGLINVPGYKIDIYVSYLNGTLLAFLYRQLTMFLQGLYIYCIYCKFTVWGELRGGVEKMLVECIWIYSRVEWFTSKITNLTLLQLKNVQKDPKSQTVKKFESA